ncbi:hypothetical protein PUNSTDRAFT_109739 [Punctularia strigosozonata HHB-11173 SS5]|uniref:uncharacterized protein n=1 Tax=Punctularia strigosozonata (strain HHB-11173) TaxID=741275 RepID=UPI0004418124|nr:uncharacterized protein PUNSTDRAFT_109739 [Punctularia strigosozonata HHB-11173 SS5]EIN13540.1 hypothetical protein PUNSTDRAFT_109739 [Punctularia strigosozonata HHB-11173 SS5]
MDGSLSAGSGSPGRTTAGTTTTSSAPTSWVDLRSSCDSEELDLEYLRSHPSAALPPSPYSPSDWRTRPSAPTPHAAKLPIPTDDADSDAWSPVEGPARPPLPRSRLATAADLSDMVSNEDYYAANEASDAPASAPVPATHSAPAPRVPKAQTPLTLPDPSHFPDPYPSPHPMPGLISSADSSSASTRSSAYTSFGSALAQHDFVHVHAGSDESEHPHPHAASGVLTEAVRQAFKYDGSSPTASPFLPKSTMEGRWSGSDVDGGGTGLRSRSSSLGRMNQDGGGHHPLRLMPSYDTSWQPVDERDELLMTSEDEDGEDVLDEYEEDERGDDDRTAAIVVAEQGRGLIVRADSTPIVQLQVQPGTTHLLLGSSSTPNALPAFLTSTLPQISHSLLALDISANFLVALPPALRACTRLEELNIASNPLRALPVFLSELSELRVLIADATGISALPPALSSLERLHTLSIRRNKFNALPSWLCALHSLQSLLVNGNPFQGPWKALVEPLLMKEKDGAMPLQAPLYTPATPAFSIQSSGVSSMQSTSTAAHDTDTDGSSSDPPLSAVPPLSARPTFSPEDEDTLVPPPRAPPLDRSATAPSPLPPPPRDAPSPTLSTLSRRKTAPNRSHFERTRAASKGAKAPPTPPSASPAGIPPAPYAPTAEHQMRKMKSAGDLRRGASAAAIADPPSPGSQVPYTPGALPIRPALSHYVTSTSSASLLRPAAQAPPQRYASLGATSGLAAFSGNVPSGVSTPNSARSFSRAALDQAMWDNISADEDDGDVPERSPFAKGPGPTGVRERPTSPTRSPPWDRDGTVRASKAEKGEKDKDKSGRWGFFKKMSMGKMKDATTPGRHTRRPTTSRPGTSAGLVAGEIPQIDVRLSTTGTINAPPSLLRNPSTDLLKQGAGLTKKPSVDALRIPPSSGDFLMPSPPTPRSVKRRSFLMPEAAPSLVIPSASSFMPGLSATNGGDSDDAASTPSTPLHDSSEARRRREEERAREAYTRALRSVMAYLRDLNDLSLPVGPPKVPTVGEGARSRRPTLADGGRSMTTDSSMASDATDAGSLFGSTLSSVVSGTSSQLRSPDSMTLLRSVSTANTLSIATTDSEESSGPHERKFKDDKSKRSMIVREIIETERTYVKGLQELVDIYIKPAEAPVNTLAGSSSKKETVVPAIERKVVFGGVEALFSFHKESFLPALERVASPLMQPSSALATADADGSLSMAVARNVAQTFISHAAFMKMYSTYINNFDNSVNRLKQWTTDRPPAAGTMSPPSVMSPSSSTGSQLAGLGLRISASVAADSAAIDGATSSTISQARLSSGQRKRIKAYLKRCRTNPRHSQLNLEGYLLLPVQRIPRYRLLLEQLGGSTVPTNDQMQDPLDKAVEEISSLATNMNEGKRDSESRRKLVQWQSRIRGKFPSPLVQPHRRLIMDGPLRLTRVVRKTAVSYEVVTPQGDATMVQVECLSPEMTPRSLTGILCNDLLVLCRDPSEGQDTTSTVDLWAVLRMQTLPQPASIVHANVLRIVDNKAVLYFDAPSPSDALNWYRAINTYIPASKT